MIILFLVYLCIGIAYAFVFYDGPDEFIVFGVLGWPFIVLISIFIFIFKLIDKLCKKLKEYVGTH